MNNKKYILITGATGGLGSSVTNFFWDLGFNLILVARDLKKLESIKNNLKKNSIQTCEIYKCNLGDKKEVDKFIKYFMLNNSNLDILINNAAIHGPIGPSQNTEISELLDAFQVNLFSPIMLCNSFSKIMEKRGGGVIINISGGGAATPRPNFSCYSITKTALVRFTEILSIELKNKNITANCIAPGMMNTKLLKEIIDNKKNLANDKEYIDALNFINKKDQSYKAVNELLFFLTTKKAKNITGRLISAVWDKWQEWPKYSNKLINSDLYTLRRITARDKNMDWGDK